MKRLGIFLSVLLISMSLLGACGNDENKDQEDHESEGHKTEKHEAHQTSGGDLRQETESREILPEFLGSKSDDMKNVYIAVAMHQELLEHIPCYCGCGESVGHKNNYDCYIHENKDGGSVVWDDHATRCQACLDIAVESILEYKDGKSIKEIRKMIDEKYKEGYGTPTPTPEV